METGCSILWYGGAHDISIAAELNTFHGPPLPLMMELAGVSPTGS